jgi:hypothetical protein
VTEKSASRKAKRDALSPPRCEIPDCEWTYNFQRHRIVPGRDGGKYKKGNVISLCPNHHAQADDGVLPADYLLEIVQTRINEELNQQSELGTASPSAGGSCPSEESGIRDGVGSADAADGLEVGVAE